MTNEPEIIWLGMDRYKLVDEQVFVWLFRSWELSTCFKTKQELLDYKQKHGI